jgi:polysaccharide pyruvyl transferase WcaK-like protein
MPSSSGSKSNLKIVHIHVWDKDNKGDHAIVLAVQELLRARFKGCRISNFPMTVLRDGTAAELKKINNADYVVIGGGGIFYSYFLPYSRKFIKGITKPIIIFGAGYIREVGAPALSRESASSVAVLAKQAALVGVRDHNTKRFLEDNGVPGAKIKVIGDPAVLLKSKRPVGFKLSMSQGHPIRIGLNLNYSGWLGFGRWREDILAAYRSVAAYFQKECGRPSGPGLEIYYLKHHPGEDNIYPALGIADLRIVDRPAAEQKYIYGQLDLVVGMMLHAGVLAFGAGTPEVSVAYDLRNHSFAEFIGRPELVVDLDRLKKRELLKIVKRVFARRSAYRRLFRRKAGTIRKIQIAFLNKIKKI